MFPNPTKDELTIQIEGEGEIIVNSLLGQVLFHTEIDQIAKIDVSQFDDSVVLIEIITSGQRFIERIVID